MCSVVRVVQSCSELVRVGQSCPKLLVCVIVVKLLTCYSIVELFNCSVAQLFTLILIFWRGNGNVTDPI